MITNKSTSIHEIQQKGLKIFLFFFSTIGTEKYDIIEEIYEMTDLLMKTKYVPILCVPETLEDFDKWINLENSRKKYQKLLRVCGIKFSLDFDLPVLGNRRNRSQSMLEPKTTISKQQTDTYLHATFVIHNDRIVAEYRNNAKRFDFSQFVCDTELFGIDPDLFSNSKLKMTTVRKNESSQLTQLVDLLISPTDNKNNILSPRSPRRKENDEESKNQKRLSKKSSLKDLFIGTRNKRSQSVRIETKSANNLFPTLSPRGVSPVSPRGFSVFSPRGLSKIFTGKTKKMLDIPSPRETVEEEILSLENLPNLEIQDVLDNLEFRKFFKLHLKNEWCAENIVFYEEIEIYKKLDFNQRKEKSLEMIQQFFSTASMLEINTSQTLKNDVLAMTKNEEAPLDLFDEIIF
eukprot:gene9092-1187_t